MSQPLSYQSGIGLPPRTRTEHVYERLRKAILDGRVTAGERLITQKIARQFGVSLTPVRESIQRLAKEGLVTLRPHCGAIAAAPQRKEFLELYEVRAALERLATSLATPNLCEKDFQRLEDTQTIGREVLRGQRNKDEWVAADELFHEIIIRRSGNNLLTDMLVGLRDQIRLHRQTYFNNTNRIAESVGEHDRVIDSLRHHIATDASDRMYEHLTSYMKSHDWKDPVQ